jgi:hypothetical protein
MNVRSVLLISGPREGRPPLREALQDDLRRLEERKGEMIAAVDGVSGQVLGTLGVYPDRDEGGTFYHLSGIQMEPGHRVADLDVLLLEKAGLFLQKRRVTRLKLGTSPLLTRNAWLYVTRFGSRYRWREGIRAPNGRPWPYVSCEVDFDDPLARSLDLPEDEVRAHSILSWEGGRPVSRPLAWSGPLAVVLPDLDADFISAAAEADPQFISTLYSAFHGLHLHGYEFAWFDRLPEGSAPAGAPRWYYVMKRVVSF